MRFSGFALVATALTMSSSMAAQQKGAVELGAFMNVGYFDKSLAFDQGEIAPGARLGYFFTDRLELETEFTRAEVDGPSASDVLYMPLRGRFTYNLPLGTDAAFLIGAGYVHNFYRRDIDGDDDGATGHVGIRLGASDPFQIRIGSYVDFMPSPANGASDNWNYGFNVGLSYVFGNKRTPPDADKDGVPDATDRCPATPAQTVVDPDGCSAAQRDSDGDRVNDAADRCPNTPAGDAVDAQGCSLPKDADKDGVVDASDACPATPAGAKVDARGCAPSQLDADRDGVTDDLDKCPDTPPGTKVDAMGCAPLPEAEPLVLKGVTFETGKAVLTPNAETILKEVAKSLVANPAVKVEVQGHTDATGSRATNVRLSQTRAEAVRDFLVKEGVAADRLTAKGYGPDDPIASNKTPEGRAENRRVVLKRAE